MSSFGVTEFNLAIEYALWVLGKENLTLKQAQRHAIYQIVSEGKDVLGAVHMSRASPANRADFSHENLYFSTT